MNRYKLYLAGVVFTVGLMGCSEKVESQPTAQTTTASITSMAPVAAATSTAPVEVSYAKDKNGCSAYPKEQWLSEVDAKAKVLAMGYTIKEFKVSGNCYEIYGRDKSGNKVEIYFDAKTMAVVKMDD